MDKESSFSVALWSRNDLTGLTLNGDGGEGVSLNGLLGEINDIHFLDDSVMVITGDRGEIRLDLAPDTLSLMMRRGRP